MSGADPARYDAQAVEKAAQAHWQARDAYRVTEDTSKPPRRNGRRATPTA